MVAVVVASAIGAWVEVAVVFVDAAAAAVMVMPAEVVMVRGGSALRKREVFSYLQYACFVLLDAL